MKFIILSVIVPFYVLLFLSAVCLCKAAKNADEILEKITKKSACSGLKN